MSPTAAAASSQPPLLVTRAKRVVLRRAAVVLHRRRAPLVEAAGRGALHGDGPLPRVRRPVQRRVALLPRVDAAQVAGLRRPAAPVLLPRRLQVRRRWRRAPTVRRPPAAGR